MIASYGMKDSGQLSPSKKRPCVGLNTVHNAVDSRGAPIQQSQISSCVLCLVDTAVFRIFAKASANSPRETNCPVLGRNLRYRGCCFMFLPRVHSLSSSLSLFPSLFLLHTRSPPIYALKNTAEVVVFLCNDRSPPIMCKCPF